VQRLTIRALQLLFARGQLPRPRRLSETLNDASPPTQLGFRPAIFSTPIGNDLPTTSSPAAAQQPSLAVLLASSFAFIIDQLDVTIVNVALPKMGVELGAQVSTLQWVIYAYTLGFASFLLSAGVIGDKFGAKRAFLSGFALFTGLPRFHLRPR
jgi:hypothetical protein